MQIRSAVFELSAPDLASCPESALPEFAFIGRSNVGKSSMINLLTGRKDLAKVSATPGKTRLINFFLINDRWHLIDLPGYGYAKVSKDAREIFADFIADYLANRPGLRHLFVLIDSRLDPQAIDLDFLQWAIDHAVPFSIVFTKADKMKPNALKKSVATFLDALALLIQPLPEHFVTSSKLRQGRNEILGTINTHLSRRPENEESVN